MAGLSSSPGCAGLRADGVPVQGLTWWPLVDFVDWGWASGGAVVEEFYLRDGPSGQPRLVRPAGVPGGPVTPFLRRMGIYSLRADGDGRLAREPTGLLDRFRFHAAGELIAQPIAHPDQYTP